MTKKMEAFDAQEFVENNDIKTPVFGIDLGTTNSAIAVVQKGNSPRIIFLNGDKKKTTMPSCIMWQGKPNEFVVGHAAYDKRYQRNAIYSIKRLMGKDTPTVLTYSSKELVMSPEEVSAEILKGLVSQASLQYKNIKDVVITVPAYFDSNQVLATKKAGMLAGLNVLGILREPTAASLVYNIEVGDKKERRVLVYDLGGGTFDVSLIRITNIEGGSGELSDLYGDDDEDNAVSSKTYTVLDTSGDSHLGGDDIDRELLAILLRKLEAEGIDVARIPNMEKEKWLLRLEKIKIMGAVGNYTFKVKFKYTGGNKEGFISAAPMITIVDLKEAIFEIYKKTRRITNEVLKRTTTPVEEIVLVGGSTKSELLRDMLRKDFPDVELNGALHPDQSVALGAAVKGKEIKYGDANVEVFDVIPMSIGVQAEGHFSPIIPKNSQVPTHKRKVYRTTVDNQKEMSIAVYQGNSVLLEECTYLNNYEMTNLPEGKAGEISVSIEMSVDTDGILKMVATTANEKKEMTVVNLFGGQERPKALSPEERRIAKWRSFARGLGEEDKQALLATIEQFEDGVASMADVTSMIAKHRSKPVVITAPDLQSNDYGM